LFAVIFICLAFTFKFDPTLNSLFINLAASSFFALITIFGVEWLKDSKSHSDTIEGEKSARLDAARMSRMMVWWVGEPFGENVLDYDPSIAEDDNANIAIKKLRSLDMQVKLSGLSHDRWERLASNSKLLQDQIDNYSKYYSDMTPRGIYSKYITARRLHAGITRYLEPSPLTNLLVKDEGAWPTNKYGRQQNISIRDSLVSGFMPLIIEYLGAIDDLHDAVTKWHVS
jgi:hypothetical protein